MTFPHPEPTRLWSIYKPGWVYSVPRPKHDFFCECYECNDFREWHNLLRNSTYMHAKKEYQKNIRKLASITGSENRRARMKNQWVEDVVAARVFRRDKWICGICGTAVSQLNDRDLIDIASLDHIIPLSKGGEHSYANTQLAHLSCNLRKGAKTPKIA